MRPLVVVGDALLDVDVEGRAHRLCPEAPVPVVDADGEWLRPGGAGLAAALLGTRASRDTPDVQLVTALGDDDTGRRLDRLLAPDVEVLRLPLVGETVRKTRVRAAGQSIVRVDTGDGHAAHTSVPAAVRRAVSGAGAVLVSDYGRGVAAHPELRALLTEVARRVPVVWDPHPRGPVPIPGAALATPNESEALGFAATVELRDDSAHSGPRYSGDAHSGSAGGDRSGTDRSGDAGTVAARALCRAWGCTATAVTIGARGAVLAGAGVHGGGNGSGAALGTITVPVAAATAREHRPDTCGAGDRFASAAAAALWAGADLVSAVRSAVDAASRFVAAGGASALSVDAATAAPARNPAALVPPGAPGPAKVPGTELAERVRREGGRLVATGGCFDLLHAGHIALLRQARALGDALVVCLNSDDSVRRIKGPTRPVVPAADRARVLEELASVDAVVLFDESAPAAALEHLRPHVWVKGGDYTLSALPEADVVRRHGGEVVLIDTVDGYSTTKLVQDARRGTARARSR